jgi:signal transduction histidine kinase
MNATAFPSSSSMPSADSAERLAPAILIVDDNQANLLAFQAILEPLGAPVVTAASGEEALRSLLQRDFAVIVLDVQMPKMSGFELAALIKSHSRLRCVPIIFVTAISRDMRHVFTGYAHGAVDYLVKPLEPEILRAKVSVFIELYRAQQTIATQARRLHRQEMRELERRNDERLRGLTESMPVPVWGVDAEGVVYACNRAWTEYSGRTADETGCIVNPLWMHAADIESASARWTEGTSAAEPFDIECRLLRACDERFRWHVLHAVPERGDRAREGCWIVAATDIDAQKTVERERAHVLAHEHRAREEAEAANRMKDEFLATVSHELRTPLNAILGWSRMMRTGTLDAAGHSHAIETIERNARVQAKLIDDLLDVSQIVSGKLLLQVGSLNLHTVVSDAIEALRPLADAMGIDVRCEKSPWDGSMCGDPSRLQQIVWNLVSNAVKFTPKGGCIDVRVEHGGDGAYIIVKDNGRGIHPAFLPHVFDRFRQEDSTISREHEGLGLGLSIVKHLVELHDGSVHAESAGLGRGATFTVRLPTGATGSDDVVGVEPPVFRCPIDEGGSPAVLPNLEHMRVLFVDDQAETRELVSLLLGRYGARVLAVESAERALGVLHSFSPHVLISDIGLPGEDGYSLIRRVRALGPSTGGDVPAVALTAYAGAEDRRRSEHAGYQMHLAKPVESDELVSVVASLVRWPERSDTIAKLEASTV